MKHILLIIVFFTLSFSEDLEKVNLYLKWKHQFQFAGFYIAKEKGFFEEVGLDIDLIESNSKQNIVDTILNEENSFGISDSSLINSMMSGDEISLMMAIFQETPFAFLFLKESDIKIPNDFRNKKIMLDMNHKDNAFVRLFLEKFKLGENNISIIPTSYDINDLIEKDVDIFNGYITNEPYILKEKGIEYDYLKASSFGMNFYGDILFTSLKNEKNNPEMVKAFFDASMKGWKYAFENIDETINLILDKYNTQNFTYDKYLFEAISMKELSGIDSGKFGRIELTKVNQIMSTYFLIENNFTLEKINNLDVYSLTNERFFNGEIANRFTSEEENYLKSKDKLTYCASTKRAPFTFLKKNEFKGISIDFLKLIENKLNKRIEPIFTKNWEECYSLLKQKKVDLTPIIVTNHNIFDQLKPTIPYADGYLVVATKISEPYLLDISQLENKILGVIKDARSVNSYIKSNFPNLKIKEIDGTVEDGLELIRQGKIYGLLGASDIISYNIQKKFTYELKIMKRLSGVERGSIGVQKDNKILFSILNKAIKNIDEKEFRNIKNSWTFVKEDAIINREYLINIASVIALISLAFFYKQYILNESNKELKVKVKEEVKKNREKDKILFQQIKLASMGEMLNNIAHQWRQPLNVINSNVAVIDSIFNKHKIDDERLENTLSEIESQTRHMSDTIESFRTYFNPAKEKDNFLLSQVVDDVLRIVKFDYEKSNIKIKVFNQNDINVEGFIGEYIQTIIAILNNAKDAFTEKNIENAEVNIFIDEMLIIDDNAGGMKDEIIDRIFEPYFTTKYKNKGTGTGLYMAKMIIENSMNGNLSVEKIKNGTRFKIKI